MRYPSGRTHLYAILADPVAHVRAAEFFNPVFEERRLDAFLVPLHVRAEDLAETVPRLARIGNLKGFIITIPHKEPMAALCAELGPDARAVGAVNTVRIEEGGRLVGEMFDGQGLLAGMRAGGIEVAGESVLLVGAGGAGRAIAFKLAEAGAARLTVANRTEARAVALARDVRGAFPNCPVAVGPADPAGHGVIINATSLGLKPGEPMPLDPARLEAGAAYVDIIAARDTELMQAAKDRGLKVIGGRPMVDHQIPAQIEFLRPPGLAS